MSSWETDLHDAVVTGDLSRVKTILSRDEVRKNGNLGRKEWSGPVRPLQAASFIGTNEMVQTMSDSGFDLDSFRVDGNARMTALHNAVWANKGDTVKLLLDLGADPSIKGVWPAEYALGTPLEWARQKKGQHEEVAKILKEYMAKKPAWLASFKTMDSVVKLKQKSRRIKELEEADKLVSEIEAMKAQATKMEEDIKKEKEMMAKTEAKLQTTRKEIKKMEEQSVFRYREELKRQLDEIMTLERSLKEVLKVEQKEGAHACPVCLLSPQQIFTCEKCENWVCQECQRKLFTCPNCRADLAIKPMKRCKVAEKVLGIP